MPELPEVETVKRGLEKLVIGKKIIAVSHDWLLDHQEANPQPENNQKSIRVFSSLGIAEAMPQSDKNASESPGLFPGLRQAPWRSSKSFPNDQKMVDEFMIGATIKSLRRRGKAMMMDLSTHYSLVVHLKMTGQMVFVGEERFGAGHPNDSLIDVLPDKSTRVTITFADKSKLFFNDQRKFGWVKLLPTVEVEQLDFFKKLGPEPLVDSFSNTKFIDRVQKRKNTTIKAALLDQSVLAGVGNIYADESLFTAQIHPARRVHELTNKQLSVLLDELKTVMNLSIEKGGSSDRNYVDAEGKKGSYISFAKVFRKEGQPCVVDGSIILKSRVAGRGTHYCPTCQPAPRGFK